MNFFFLAVPELEEAFKRSEEDFAALYGFPKPAKTAENVVLGCRSGVRVMTALDKLNAMGYSSIKYVPIPLCFTALILIIPSQLGD